ATDCQGSRRRNVRCCAAMRACGGLAKFHPAPGDQSAVGWAKIVCAIGSAWAPRVNDFAYALRALPARCPPYACLRLSLSPVKRCKAPARLLDIAPLRSLSQSCATYAHFNDTTSSFLIAAYR